ncbi:MAG: hypothetical protein IPK42_23680, partial [Betaproteobacteria bacterium]|nr:hypothetical protein [Betaproteobacteria bacterium]
PAPWPVIFNPAPHSLSKGPRPHFGEENIMPQVQDLHRILLLARPARRCHGGPRQTASKVLNVYNWSDYIADEKAIRISKEMAASRSATAATTACNEILQAGWWPAAAAPTSWCPRRISPGTQIAGGLYQAGPRATHELGQPRPGAAGKLADIDFNNEHLVTWMWGYVTVGINTAKVKAALGATPMPASWSLVADPQYASKLRAAASTCWTRPRSDAGGHDLRQQAAVPAKPTKDYDAAREVLIEGPLASRVFVVGLYRGGLAAGQLCVVMGYSGDISNIARQRTIETRQPRDIQALIPLHRRDAVR